MSMREDQARSVIVRSYDDPRWQGFGYLGERRRVLLEDPRAVRVADSIVAEQAHVRGWDAERLFHWVNSKPGRWFGDRVFGWPPEERRALFDATDGLFDGDDWMP